MNWKERLEGAFALFNQPLFSLGGTPVTLATIATGVVIVSVAFVISSLLRRAFHRGLKGRLELDAGTLGVASRLLHYLVVITGFAIALHTIGINLTGLFAAGALFAVGIGFAMQNLTANFVSGIILLLERAIKPGDVLEVEGQMVRVKDMGIRATVARTLDDEDLVVPNSQLVQSTVTNYTLRDQIYRLRVAVGAAYESDVEEVIRILEKITDELPWRYKERQPVVLLSDFGSSSIDFEISVWIEDPWRARRAGSDLRRAIWRGFKDSSITIAFPQVDVHFDPPVVESLRGLERAV